jgi:hypothetical protein
MVYTNKKSFLLQIESKRLFEVYVLKLKIYCCIPDIAWQFKNFKTHHTDYYVVAKITTSSL